VFRPINLNHIVANDIQELYYILPVDNFQSVLAHGILSHNAVREINHSDISNSSVQGHREKAIESPRTHKKRSLHDYVNFYLQPYNAMLLVIQDAENLCLLRISKTLLEDRKDQAILTNKNAACSSAEFFKPEDYRLSPTSSKTLTSRCLKGDDGRYLEPSEFNARKPKRQAEALFPDQVPADYISGVFVYNEKTKKRIASMIANSVYAERIDVTVKSSIFPMSGYNAYNQRFSPFEVPCDEESKLATTSSSSSSSAKISSKGRF